MKARYLIPPAVALIVVGVWNFSQNRTISSLREERNELRERVSSAQPATGSRATGRPGRAGAAGGAGSFDWKTLAGQLSGQEEGVDEVAAMRAMMQFEQRVERMSKEELIATLDEIADADLTDEERENLESLVLGPLIEADPELALAHFSERIQNEPDGIGWQLSAALRQWAASDLSAATAWFDRQIAAGKFDSKTLDGRSDLRLQYESALMENLLEVDVAAAGNRLSAIPDDQRREVLEQMVFSDLSPTAQQSYAGLVRGLVPESERPGSFAHIAAEMASDGGFTAIGDFLDSVNANPAERMAAARHAADSHLEQLAQEGKITSEQVDEMREWLNRQAPALADRITGKALGEAAQEGGEFSFSDASQLVLQYNKNSPNDEVLVGFLQSYAARSNFDEAKHLAEMIKDPNRRREVLEQLE